MRVKDLLKEGVSYEFGGDAYRQNKERESKDWTEYVDYTDLDTDFSYKGKKYITVNAAREDYSVRITGREGFEVYLFDEDGENPKKVKDTDGLYKKIATELNDLWYDQNKDNDDY